MKFCHISPTAHLDSLVGKQTHHLLLAHLVESDPDYAKWYTERKHWGHEYPKTSHNDTYILDNSAFELYKAGKEMYPSDKLIEMGRRVRANYIVMSDYPGMHSSVTIEAAQTLAPEFRKACFKTFFVPQSRVGDLEDYIDCFAWAATSRHVDYIGVSILGVPNAYGVEKDNKLQRFFSRYAMMLELEKRGILAAAKACGKKIHFLGMVDGPNEISLVHPRFHIDTWDSSSAIWAGFNGIQYDNSPTGLLNGKFEKEVEFDFQATIPQLQLAELNMFHIESLIDL